MNRRPKKAPSEIPPPRLSGFAPAIASLIPLGLPAKRLAELFGTNPGYIHVLAHRGRLKRSQRPATAVETEFTHTGVRPFADDDSVVEAKRALRIRAEEDGVELTRRKATKLAWLELRMDEIVSRGRNTYQFLQAATALQALKPYIGYPSESNRLRLDAKLHQHLAWFYSHNGFTSSSIAEATFSIHLYEIVYHNTGDKDALRELGGSCLIRSNSCLLQTNPEAALATLKLAQQATLAADVHLNSEYFQQSGVALFQARQDVMAKAMFETAMKTTPDDDVKNRTITLKMASDRFLNLIAAPFPLVDDELILLDEAQRIYGADSLEAAMCVHWAAACGLCTDSPKAHELALNLILENQPNATRFGHQTTIAKLLPLALELPSRKRPLWVRTALYQNAFRNR
jgi:hypothetical protein